MLNAPTLEFSHDLAALQQQAGRDITSAIHQASQKTGVDFSYLLQQAQVESSFKADAKAKTSSAAGLYQFLESTWLKMVDKYGDKYGLSHYADEINAQGKVSDAAQRAQILGLRNNPQICALMAGEFAAENKNYLESCTAADIGATELYMAHFMGAGGAAKFLNAMDKNPASNAAKLFPDAAAANKNIFYHKDGSAKTLAEVYGHFDKKFALANNLENSQSSTNQGTCEVSPLASATPYGAESTSISPSFSPSPAATPDFHTDPTIIIPGLSALAGNYADASPAQNIASVGQSDQQDDKVASLASASSSGSSSGAATKLGALTNSWWSHLSPVDLLELLKNHQA